MPGHRAEGHEPDTDEATEAIIEGDLGFRRGTAQAALRNRDFRIFWGGTFASNIGTWMQNVLLGAFGYELTGSAVFVGILFFAQLGPLLFMSTVGGVLADVVDRRKLLIITQVEQLVLSMLLAVLAAGGNPSRVALVACVFAIGVGNSLSAPAIAAILPTLVPRADLPGAVSLQSVQMNLSRVIGPAIGAVIYSRTGAAPVFAINAGTYIFAVAGAISVGTLLAGRSKAPIPRLGLVVFAGLLTVFALLRTDVPAYPLGFVLGFFYFLVITSLATVLQENVDDSSRGRIMALWIMGFGGIVPVGVLVGGFVANYTSVTLVLLIGAAAALLLAPYAKLDTLVASARRS